MNYELKDIMELIADKQGLDNLSADSDLYKCGIRGDDFHELMEAYGRKFNVRMDNYLWYFHTREEGTMSGLGSTFFSPPNERVERIPVTPRMLTEIANKGSWDLKYPAHVIPKNRWGLIINTAVFVALLSVILIALILAS